MSGRGWRGGGGGARGARGARVGGARGGGMIAPAEVYRPAAGLFAPNPTSTQIEESCFQPSVENALRRLNLNDETGQPTRPSYASAGMEVVLYANYMAIHVNKPKPFYWYSVSMQNSSSQSNVTQKIAYRVVQLLLPQLPTKGLKVTDFGSIILSTADFGFDTQDFPVSLVWQDQNTPPPQAPIFTVTVRKISVFSMQELVDYLSASNLDRIPPPSKLNAIQALNILIGHGFKEATSSITSRKEQGVGNKYFAYSGLGAEKLALGNLLEVFRGFSLSARPATGRLLLNVQIKHIACYPNVQVDRYIQYLQSAGYTALQADRMLRTLKVQLLHLGTHRVTTLTGLAKVGDGNSMERPPRVPVNWASAEQVEFHMSKGGYKKVSNHFRETYAQLQNPTAPVVITGSRDNPIYFPSEVCKILPGQPFRAQLSPEQTAEMIKIAVRKPHLNARTIIEQGCGLLQNYSDTQTESFGIGISKQLITVTGRIMDTPAVHYAKPQQARVQNGSWNMTSLRFTKGAKLPTWNCMSLTITNTTPEFENPTDLMKSIEGFRATLRSCGMDQSAHMPTPWQYGMTNESQAFEVVKAALRTARERTRVKLVLVILPYQSKLLYNAVKKAGDIVHGVHTVCVVASKFGAKRHQPWLNQTVPPNAVYFANLALKINLKLGGSNQSLNSNNLGFIADGDTMIVGLDVTHPSPGSKEGAPSIVGIVASVNSDLAQWPAAVKHQRGRQEMVEALQEMFTSRLRLWETKNKRLPRKIIVYRDGVSEGQYALVRDQELTQMKKAIQETYPADETKGDFPRLSIIICGKRHNTRFYPTNAEHADPKSFNNKNGTVVDRGVTESRVWDFYLQAHTALQGTARPAHYVVIHDEVFRREAEIIAKNMHRPSLADKIAADLVQTLTYNLCYMFGRATKAVSLVPPAYYADKVCERARQWLSDVFDETMSTAAANVTAGDLTVHPELVDTMFYL